MSDFVDAIIAILSNALNSIINWFQDLLLFFVASLIDSVLSTLVFFLDFILWWLDKLSWLCTGSGFLDSESAWSGVPPAVINVLFQVDALALFNIILCAMIVRFSLNFLPSWLTRA